MVRGASRLNLELYLETFAHTVGVMQTKDALHRVAAECAEDLADDGVVVRRGPVRPGVTRRTGPSLDEVVEATFAGFRDGSDGRPIRIGTW